MKRSTDKLVALLRATCNPLCRRASDEIERLRAALWQYESAERDAQSQLAACRRLLREAMRNLNVSRLGVEWNEQAARAAGGEA